MFCHIVMLLRLKCSETDGALHAQRGQARACYAAVDGSGLQVHREVGRDVEVGQRGVNIGIHDVDEIDAHHGDDADLAVAPVVVALAAHDLLQPCLIEFARRWAGRSPCSSNT